MSTLHDLRLNCLLAALVPVALGLVALIVSALLADSHHHHHRHQDLRQMTALLVAGTRDLDGVPVQRLVTDAQRHADNCNAQDGGDSADQKIIPVKPNTFPHGCFLILHAV